MKISLLKAVEVRIEGGRILAEGLLKYKQSEKELVVEGLSGGGIAIHNVFGNGMSMVSVGHGNSVYVNGKRVDVNHNKKDKDYVKMDIPLNGVKVKTIVCSGSSTLKIKDKNILDKKCTVSLSGSSDVRVADESIDELSITLSGSSDMKGRVTTERLNAQLSGSSDVSDIFVSGSGSVNTSGSSCAYISSDSKKKIKKSSSGVSKIKVIKREKADSSDSSDSSDNEPSVKKRKVSIDCVSANNKIVFID